MNTVHRTSIFSAAVGIALLGIAFASPIQAAVIESFSGTGTLSSPNDGGDALSYVALITDTQGDAQISYTITATTSDGDNVSTDAAATARGFGSTLGDNNALDDPETLVFTLSAVDVIGLNGATVTANDISVQFDSFDLVNNGNNNPRIQWDLANDGWIVHQNSGTGSLGKTETVDVTAESGSILQTEAVSSWMWVDNIQTSYTGTVTLDAVVPEPSALCLIAAGLLGLIGVGRQRRR